MKIIFRNSDNPYIYDVLIINSTGEAKKIGIANKAGVLRHYGEKISSNIRDEEWCFKSTNTNSICTEISAGSFKMLVSGIETFYMWE